MAPSDKPTKLKKDVAKYVDDINSSIKQGMATTNMLLETVLEPIRVLPDVLTKLTELGKDELADNAISIAKTIESDVQRYGPSIEGLTKKIETHLSKRESLKNRHIQDYSANGLYISQELLSLNSKLTQTTVSLAKDFSKILNEIESPKEVVNE